MNYDEILKSIKNRVFAPIYFLHGEEPFFIDKICDALDNTVLNEGEKDFNQTIVYGKDIKVSTIITMAKRFPMMASHQVILVREAQQLEQLELLDSYIDNPQKSTILVFCHKYKKLDGRKGFAKKLKKNHIVFESKKLYDNQVEPWISNYIRAQDFSISPTATFLLAEYLGNDLSRITNEVQKLLIGAEKGKTITEDEIQEKIGISKDFNVFELQKSLGRKDVLKSNQIINYFASDPKNHPIVMVIPILYSYFTNLGIINTLQDKSPRSIASALGINPYFVNDLSSAARNYSYAKLVRIIGYLREYDAKAKGVNSTGSTSNEDLLKELIYKILH
ncbi:MAG: DNA polymerase III subunit delta [Bacteroidetes bacterium 4572_112]|nr:MAG: DNA polymerase III subunit delta [Bacteroidetes bacterium 4572_112]